MNHLRAMWRLYAMYWRITFLTSLEYRTNFLLWAGFTLVYHGSAVIALWVILHAFPSLNGWTFREMAFLYGLWMLAHSLANTLFFNVNSVPEHVREGEFDRMLVRPHDPLFLTITMPGNAFPDEVILGLITFIGATWYSHVRIDALFVLTVPLVVIGGALIDLAISLAVAAASFWVVRVDALRWTALQLEQEFTRYPISIYGRGVRVVLTFVLPFAFMNYFPATFFLGKLDRGFAFPPAVGLLTPLVGLVFFFAAYAFWRVGVRHYEGVGH